MNKKRVLAIAVSIAIIVFVLIGFLNVKNNDADSLSVGKIEKVAENEYNLFLRESPLGKWQSAWLDFRVQDKRGTSLKYHILNIGGVGEFNTDTPKYLYYSCNRYEKSYSRLDNYHYDRQKKTYSFNITPECDEVEISTWPPYRLSKWEKFIEKPEIGRFDKKIIGNSYEKRPIYAYETGDEKNSLSACIIARQHPGETSGSFMMEGIFSRISDSAPGVRFKIVPIANPDGVYRGYTTENSQLLNMNECWDSDLCTETNSIRQYLAAAGCSLFIDIHGDAGGSDESYLGGSTEESKRFWDIYKIRSALFTHYDTATPRVNSSRGYMQDILNVTSLVFEPSQHNENWTEQALVEEGSLLVDSIADYFQE